MKGIRNFILIMFFFCLFLFLGCLLVFHKDIITEKVSLLKNIKIENFIKKGTDSNIKNENEDNAFENDIIYENEDNFLNDNLNDENDIEEYYDEENENYENEYNDSEEENINDDNNENLTKENFDTSNDENDDFANLIKYEEDESVDNENEDSENEESENENEEDKDDTVNLDDIFNEENENYENYIETMSANDYEINLATRSKIDRMIFMGDTYVTENNQAIYLETGTEKLIDNINSKLLNESDFNIANLECAITNDKTKEAEKQYTLSIPENIVGLFKDIGIGLFSLANNHILDYGEDAMLNTIEVLENNEIGYMGAGKNEDEAKKPYIKYIAGKSYAFFAASAVLPYEEWKATEDRAGVSNGYNISITCKEIKNLKGKVNKIIVFMHWGDELNETSSKEQKSIAYRLVDAGADLVVGAHPHVVQEIEYYKGVPIVYSLGNFMFGMQMRDNILLEVQFDYSIDEEGVMFLKIHPGIANYQQVKGFWEKEGIKNRVLSIGAKSPTCQIADDGAVFTEELLNYFFKKNNIEIPEN